MTIINRKWKQRGNVPCEGDYLYQAETYVSGYVVKTSWMSESKYREFKQKRIQENWK
jgi:hypothetical protein